MTEQTSDIAVFVRAVELGGFAPVAEDLGLSASGVSRMISRLERRFGARLFHRSTRRLDLTPEGEIFLGHARTVLHALEAAAEDLAASETTPRGRIRVSASAAVAERKLPRILSTFLAAHPEVSVDLAVSDRRVDIIAERIDVAIRVGPLADSDLIQIPLGWVRRVIAASPDYLARRGRPDRPEDLHGHACLVQSGVERLVDWPMIEAGERVLMPVSGPLRSDNAEALLAAAVAGLGLFRFGDFLGEEALADGRLIPLLEAYHDGDPQPINALTPPGRHRIPRIRAFLDALKTGFADAQRRGARCPRRRASPSRRQDA